MGDSAVQSNISLPFWKRVLRRPSNDYHMRIGEVLTRQQIISEEQLQKALEEKRKRFQHVGRSVRLALILTEMGYASEERVVRAINEHYGLSVNSLADDIEGQIRGKRNIFFRKLPKPSIPIWFQLSITTTLIICLVIAMLSFFTLDRQKRRLYDQSVKTGLVSLHYFANNARIPLLEDNVLRLNSLINEATSVEGLVYALIVDQDGVIKAHTDQNQLDKPYRGMLRPRSNMVKDGDVSYYNTRTETGAEVINLSRPVVFKNKKLGEVHVGVSLDFIERVIRKERQSILAMTIFSVLLGIGIAALLGFRFSRPITRLMVATREIAKGNYNHRIDLDRKDELGNLANAFNRMSEELMMKSFMQESFGKYVGTEILDLIMANPESAWLKGHRNEATVIFIDIRGFTAYSDTKEPEEVVNRLNEYFEIATRTILDYGGYVDKFIGDAVLAVFGVPVFNKDHAIRAVEAADEMQKAFEAAGQNGNPLLKSVGISINTGIVVSGNIGSQVKMEYTVIGDTVNVASRLNGLAGPGEVILSKSIYTKLEDRLEVEAQAPQMIKGKPYPVQTFKLIRIRENTT